MADYSYEAVKIKAKTFRAMTGLDVNEFARLLPHFRKAYANHLIIDGCSSETKRGHPGNLQTLEDKLIFILYYLIYLPVARSTCLLL